MESVEVLAALMLVLGHRVCEELAWIKLKRSAEGNGEWTDAEMFRMFWGTLRVRYCHPSHSSLKPLTRQVGAVSSSSIKVPRRRTSACRGAHEGHQSFSLLCTLWTRLDHGQDQVDVQLE